MKTQSKKLHNGRNEGFKLTVLNKNALKRTSNAIFDMKIVDLDES